MDALQRKLDYAEKRVKFAWAKYYEEIRLNNDRDFRYYQRLKQNLTTIEIPEHIKNELKEMAEVLKKKWECPICYDFIEKDNLEITNCGHFYCKGCLAGWKDQQLSQGAEKWRCGVCNYKFKYT